jgi:acyl carrier protein
MNAAGGDRIFDELVQIVRHFPGREFSGPVSPASRFFGDLGFVSIDAVVLGELLEEHFRQKLSFHRFLSDLGKRQAQDVTLGEVADFLRAELAPNSPNTPQS